MDFPQEQKWDEELEFVSQCCVLNWQLCTELFFWGLPPSGVACVSSVVGSCLPVKPCSCTISKSCFPTTVYLFPRILNAGLINRRLYSTFPLTISKCWVEFNYTSQLLVEEGQYWGFLNLFIELWRKWGLGASLLISPGLAALLVAGLGAWFGNAMVLYPALIKSHIFPGESFKISKIGKAQRAYKHYTLKTHIPSNF